MKQTAFISILVSFLLSACASLNKQEIKFTKKIHFQDLNLTAGEEHNELRIDVIRQVTETYIDGSTTYYDDGSTIYYEDVPYHPLGFDLGNGLFYDLNGNLSFRLDHLLDFDPNEPFEISKNIRPENESNTFLYTYINEALALTRLPQRNSRIQYHKESLQDSSVFMKNARFLYAMSKTDSSLSYTFRNNKPLKIYKIDELSYYTFRRKKLREFRNIDNTLLLGKTFIVRLSDDKNTITINSPWREQYNKKPKLTIQKDANSIFIYSKGYKGKKIEFTKNGLFVTGTKHKPILYKKIEGSGSVAAHSPINK